MPISKNELTKEMIAKAMQCQTAEEEEFSDVELDETSLQHVAGGAYNPDCNNNNAQKCNKY